MKGRKTLFFIVIFNTLAVISLFICVLYLVFSNAFGIDISRVLRVRYIEPILKKVDISPYFFSLKSSKLPTYEIVISPKKYNKLMAAREEKLKNPDFRFPYKKAKFIHEDKEYDVKVKLRGLLSNHWMEAKKSWRVKFPKDNLFKGIRSLNLIVPADKDYLKEHLAYYTAKKYGLSVPYSNFAGLRINGKYQGVYFEVEQMGKGYLARNLQPEDTNLYDGEDNYIIRNVFKDIGFWKKFRSERISKTDNYSDLYKLLEVLEASDEAFNKNIAHLVNIDKLLRWNANAMLYFDYHQNNYHNIRLLFSHISGKFEPLIWDCSHPQYNPNVDRLYNDLVTRILKNPEFLHRRNMILWDYLKDDINLRDDLSFFDKLRYKTRYAFLGDTKKDISNLRFLYVMRSIRRDITTYYDTLKDKFQDSYLHGTVHYNTGDPSVLACLELISGGFSASELNKIIIEVEGVANLCRIYYDKNNNSLFDESDLFIAESSKHNDKDIEFKDVNLVLYPDRRVEDKTLKPVPEKHTIFVINDNREPRSVKNIILECSNAVTRQNIIPNIRMVDDENFKSFDYLTLSPVEFAERFSLFEATRDKYKFVLKSGEHIIDETVIVPENVEINIEPGAVILFNSNSSFISYGRIIAKGTKENPIIIKAKDSVRKTMAVVGKGADGSIFSNVVIKDGSETFINGICFTGALAVHDSEVIISDCVFEDNHGDDALNIKKATARIENCIFRNNDFDAIDLDFAEDGIIERCQFINNGNDAIDTSSSKIVIKNNIINNCSDKGISCGEGTIVTIFNNSISGCDIGIAIKDRSFAVLINNSILNNSKGISLYNKKQIWQKGGVVTVYNTVLKNTHDIELLGDSDIKIYYSFVSDITYTNKGNSVWVYNDADTHGYLGDAGIVTEYFPEIEREKIPIGAF